MTGLHDMLTLCVIMYKPHHEDDTHHLSVESLHCYGPYHSCYSKYIIIINLDVVISEVYGSKRVKTNTEPSELEGPGCHWETQLSPIY